MLAQRVKTLLARSFNDSKYKAIAFVLTNAKNDSFTR